MRCSIGREKKEKTGVGAIRKGTKNVQMQKDEGRKK